MFLQLNHKSLKVYVAVRELTKEIYKITNRLPSEERFNMIQQARRAVLSVKLNLAEGSSRKSAQERKRYYEISRGSMIEIDALLETAVDLGYFEMKELINAGDLLNKCFAMLSNMMT
jgi:four helix bundle protein